MLHELSWIYNSHIEILLYHTSLKKTRKVQNIFIFQVLYLGHRFNKCMEHLAYITNTPQRQGMSR
jgi:hypothetical protein